MCVCVYIGKNFPLTCLDINYIDTRSINMHGNNTNCRIGDKDPKILINFVVYFHIFRDS